MSRLRAIFAILLAVTWCSAAWHGHLEAVGVMLAHDHGPHHEADDHHAPVTADDDHEQVVARNVSPDHVRVGGPGGLLWIAAFGFAVWLALAFRPPPIRVRVLRRPAEADPPLARVWHFVQRCAPQSAAPPELG